MILVNSIKSIFNKWHSRILLTLLFLVHLNCSIAQTDSSTSLKNIIIIELGGPGGYGSVNYERTILTQKKLSIQGRIGLSTVHLKNYNRKLNPDIIIPVSIHLCYGNVHKAEIGLGEIFTSMNVVNFDNYESKRKSYLHSVISLGYRYKPTKSRIFFRLAYTPVYEQNNYLKHWGSLSIGYQF